MTVSVARIDTRFTNPAGHSPIVNIELWDAVPPDAPPFSFVQISNLDSTGAPTTDAPFYEYPVGTSCSAALSPVQFFDMMGNPVDLQLTPVPVVGG